MKWFNLVTVVYLFTIINSISGLKKSLIEAGLNGLLAAFGDFNSDKITDVLVITDSGKSIEIIQGSSTRPFLKKWLPQMKCTFPNGTDDVIVGVVPGDFHGNSMMDLLVVTTDKPVTQQTHEYKLWLFKGNISHIDCNTSVPIREKVPSEPLALDWNGDMVTDVLVEGPTDACRKQVLVARNGSFAEQCLNYTPHNTQRFAFPHSNAFVDLNHPVDFVPDLLVAGDEKFEYLFRCSDSSCEQNNLNFSPVNISYPDKDKYNFWGQSTFFDVGVESIVDHVLPVCKSELPACDAPNILIYDRKGHKWLPIADFNNHTSLVFTNINADKHIQLPATLRYGDVDGDGFIDLMTVMRDKNLKKNRAVILRNVKSEDASQSGNFNRKFYVNWISDDSKDVVSASFFDLGEDGKLDILLTTKDKNDNWQIEAIENWQMIEAYFLKVLIITGLNYENDPTVIHGTNQPGPLICYDLADANGEMRHKCAGQLAQSAHFALQLPYSLFGLGETPNFVESIHASIPIGFKGSKVRKEKWTQIVPDAQVVIIPVTGDSESVEKPDYWVCKLFLQPSNLIFTTLITLASICCILVLIIGILHRKELSEDLAEHEEYKRHWPESR